MKQKIFYCGTINSTEAGVSFSEVDTYLKDGWKIVSITAQTCSIAGGQSYSVKTYGGFAIVIEK